ncbi:ABC transporter permease [Pelagicoccus sp. SDUM812003]|uniref:ABC transporter permease n=1 Tax=Pelagicoccus sp. SDUM812003 TaxID=3041267 RepID=UPI00280EB759|nr:ABC transporter permease [Pelagicoccus sp. SDUM812003]MDQ8205619.1 ABC transporter permease [Pelagicoccus sp. SDUM812003]
MLALASGAILISTFVLYTVLFKTHPVEDASRFVRLSASTGDGGVSYPVYQTLERENDSFEELIQYMALSDFLMGRDGHSTVINGASVSGNFFSTLGVRPVVGRLIQPSDINRSSDKVVVLGESVWRREFAADVTLLGESITLNGVPYVVVGIAPSSFSGLDNLAPQDFWFGAEHIIETWQIENRNWPKFITWGVLKEGVTADQALQDLLQLSARIREEHPNDGPSRDFDLLDGIEANQFGERAMITKTVLLILGLMSLLLLVALFNVANLVAVRVKSRLHEYSIFLALGANRGWVTRRLFLENSVLGYLGLVIGFLVAAGFLYLYKSHLPGAKTVDALSLLGDGLLLPVLIVVPLLYAGFISVGGFVAVSKININQGLRLGTRGTKQFFGRKLFVCFQVALSVAIVTVCSWFIESLRNAHNMDYGFEAENLVLLSVNYKLRGPQFQSAYLVIREHRRLKESLETLPEVESVGIGESMPLRHTRATKVDVDGFDFRTEPDECRARALYVGPDFFEVMGVSIVEGRDIRFEEMDYPMTKSLVNEAFVERYWPGQVAVGRVFKPYLNGPDVEVVGVCSDFNPELGHPIEPAVFTAFAQADLVFHIKTNIRTEMAKVAIMRMLEEKEPGLPMVEIVTLEESFDDTFAAMKLSALIAGFIAVLALFIAGYGLFALMFHLLRDHRNEIGIRMAIGANRGRILSWTMKECGVPVVWGLGLGLGVVLLLYGKVSDLLFAVDRFDFGPLASVVFVLVAVAIVSMIGPALRAASRQPIDNLREAVK